MHAEVDRLPEEIQNEFTDVQKLEQAIKNRKQHKDKHVQDLERARVRVQKVRNELAKCKEAQSKLGRRQATLELQVKQLHEEQTQFETMVRERALILALPIQSNR